MYQYRDMFIYTTFLVAGYTFVGIWLGEVTCKHKFFPWGFAKETDEHPHWCDTFFTGTGFFITGFCMASFEWITK